MQRLGGVKDDVDKIIVSTLEKHWGAMVARVRSSCLFICLQACQMLTFGRTFDNLQLWWDPSMTSREHNHHSVERTLLSRLVTALTDLDSSFRQVSLFSLIVSDPSESTHKRCPRLFVLSLTSPWPSLFATGCTPHNISKPNASTISSKLYTSLPTRSPKRTPAHSKTKPFSSLRS